MTDPWTPDQIDRHYQAHEDYLRDHGIPDFYDWLDNLKLLAPNAARKLETQFELVLTRLSQAKQDASRTAEYEETVQGWVRDCLGQTR